MTINAIDFANLSNGLKYNYDPMIPELLRAESPLLNMLEDDYSFSKDRGGRKLLWEIILDRQMNIGVRDEDDFFPGMSTDTNDDIDRVAPVEVEQSIGYAYATIAVTEHQMAPAHKDFEFFKGYGLARWLKEMQKEFRMQLEWMLLGDKTGFLGQVRSVSLSGGNTIVGVEPVTTHSTRGVHGTQRLFKNQKISFIRAADWASNARRAYIDSNISNLGTPIHKIVSVGQVAHSVSATPTITVGGNLTAATGSGALAVGDIIVMGKSRAASATGGVAASAALADLKSFDGLFNIIDDGTLDPNLYNLTRSSYPDVNSTVDLSTTGRNLTQTRLQVLFDQIRRRRGHDDASGNMEDEYLIAIERSIATNFASDPGDAAKRYIQEDKAKRLVAGFKNVTMAFLENDTLLPLVRLNTMPYGHALVFRPKGVKAMWDIKPQMVKADGLTLRQVYGKPVYYAAMQAVGNYKVAEPWFDGRLSGLNGTFTA